MTVSGCCPPTPTDQYNTKRVFYHLLDYKIQGVSGEAPQVLKGTNPLWYTVIDVATLSQTLSPVKENDAYVINLEVLDISFSDFQELFYPTFGEFIPNKNLYHTQLYKFINNSGRKVIKVCDDHRGLIEPIFNLYDELVHAYELTLGVKSECWLPCALTNLHSSVSKVNNLLDVGGCCNVECSLTFEEFVLRAMQNGVRVNSSGNMVDKEEGSCEDVIVAAITAVFKSTTEGVPDVHVNWPFRIKWNALNCKPDLINLKKLWDTVRTKDKIDSDNPPGWWQLGEAIKTTNNVKKFFGTNKIGNSVAMSKNGEIVAVGAPYNDNDGGTDAGAVTVYRWNCESWEQMGEPIIGNSGFDRIGYSLAMNDSGKMLIIGCPDKTFKRGVARIYQWNGDTWEKIGSDIEGDDIWEEMGWSVAMSNNGDTISIGAPKDTKTTTQTWGWITYEKPVSLLCGNVRVYKLIDSEWHQLGSDIFGQNTIAKSGWSLAMSGDGLKVAIGAIYGNDTQHGSPCGTVSIYEYHNSGDQWSLLGDTINGDDAYDYAGWSVAMNDAGTTVAISAIKKDNEHADNIGQVRIFDFHENKWSQRGDDIVGLATDDKVGYSIAMNNNGRKIAITSPYNDNTMGVNAGAVTIYEWKHSSWEIQKGGRIIGKNKDNLFGYSVAMSGNGKIIIVGSNDKNGNNSGDVRIFKYNP